MDQNETIDRIYEAGAISETWPDVLESLSDRYGCTGGVLFAHGFSGSHSWISSPRMKPMLDEFIRDGWAEINEKPKRISALNYPGFINDLDVFTFEEIEQDRVYREFYAPRNLGWAAGAMMPVPSGDTLIFSFERAFRKGPFEDHELLELDDLRPHLARAALWSSRLDLQRAQQMTSALQSVGLPAGVLREGGRLYAANPLLEKFIPTVLRDTRERVTLSDHAADMLLGDAIDRLAVPGAEGQSRSIPLKASLGQPPMIIHVLPVRGQAMDIFSKSVALIVVTTVDRAVVPTAEVLQGLFDLTPAESNVARAIAEGKAIDAIAAASGLSRETIRSQLAAVFGKTGMSRQAELVALLSGKGLPGV